VIATRRRPQRVEPLHSLGASEVLIDNGQIADAVHELANGGVDCVLDLVGNSVLRDSLRAVGPGGRVCQAGFLGGLGPVDEFQPVFDMPSGVQLSFFGSFEIGSYAYPMSAIPLQRIVEKVEAGDYEAAPSRVLSFEEIADAHRIVEAGDAAGKLVVTGP
jgi:NADPH:quinone reductase